MQNYANNLITSSIVFPFVSGRMKRAKADPKAQIPANNQKAPYDSMASLSMAKVKVTRNPSPQLVEVVIAEAIPLVDKKKVLF